MKKNLILFLCAMFTVSAVNAVDAYYDTLDTAVEQQGGYNSADEQGGCSSNNSSQGENSNLSTPSFASDVADFFGVNNVNTDSQAWGQAYEQAYLDAGQLSNDDDYSDVIDVEMASQRTRETTPDDLIDGLNGTADMYQTKLKQKMQERVKLDKQLKRLGTEHDVKKIRKKIEAAQKKIDALHREENGILRNVSVYKRMAEILEKMDVVDKEMVGLQALIDGVAHSQDEAERLRG